MIHAASIRMWVRQLCGWSLLLVGVLIASAHPVSAQQQIGPASSEDQTTLVPRCEYLVICRPTVVHWMDEGRRCAGPVLPCGSILEIRLGGLPAADQHSWPVLDPSGTARPCFVARPDAVNIEEMRRRVLAARVGSEDPLSDPLPATLPRIVALADRRLAEAWQVVAPLATENWSLPPKDRIPDPHWTLAHLWTALGCYSDAMEEFLRGAQISREQGRGDLLAYAQQFTVLEEGLRNATSLPGTPYANEARRYWGAGCHQIRLGQWDRALLSFTDAVRLDPSAGLYWYSRGLTYRMLNLPDEAERDARIGVTVERERSIVRDRSIDRGLEVFQGPSRVWLEEMRNGDGVVWRRFELGPLTP